MTLTSFSTRQLYYFVEQSSIFYSFVLMVGNLLWPKQGWGGYYATVRRFHDF